MTKYIRNCLPNELNENKEEFRLIWLDENINDSDDSIKTQIILLGLNPFAQFFTNTNQCIDVIRWINDEQVLLIVSGSLSRSVLPEIHHLRSMVAIFIFCADRQCHVSLKNDYKKIIEVFTDQDSLLESIRQTMRVLDKQTINFTLFNQQQKTSRDLSKESASFLWHQMILYILKQMPQDEQSKKDMLDKCIEYYHNNENELNMIKHFRNNYCPKKAIEWYTKECFLYKLLNRALRTEDIELIYAFRFFIIDMCTEIEQEHFKLKNNGVFTTFRGQQISVEELDRWKNNIGTIISINGFFSTSRNIETSLVFARLSTESDDMRSIILEIEVDSSLEKVIWVDISDRTHFENEQEIIFNLNSLFKIVSVDFDSTCQFWKIQLKATEEGADNVEPYLISIKEQIDESSSIICFGWLLLNELGQVNQAEKYFQMLLRSLPPDHPDIPSIYNGIGRVHSERNELDLALANYEKAYKMRLEQLPSNHSHIASSLHNVANMMKEKGEFDLALDKYQEALTIEEENHPDDHLQKAVIIQNIGNTLTEKVDLDTALNYLSRALYMLQHILPEQHPKISTCLGDIGSVYEKKNDFEKALDYYHKEFDMDERCLPPDHPHLSRDLNKLIIIYKKCKKDNEALEFCRQKLDLQKTIPGNNHSRIAKTLMNMATIIEEKSLSEAVKYYQEALSYLEKSTQIDHRTMAECFAAMGSLYGMHKSFRIALKYLLQALNMYHTFLLSNHSNVADVCRLIAHCYQKTNETSKALFYFNKSLSIYRAEYGADHEYVKLMESNIAKLNDEQLITITVSSDSRESLVKLSLPTAVDSTASPTFDRIKIKCETETLRKSKLCPKCEIL